MVISEIWWSNWFDSKIKDNHGQQGETVGTPTLILICLMIRRTWCLIGTGRVYLSWKVILSNGESHKKWQFYAGSQIGMEIPLRLEIRTSYWTIVNMRLNSHVEKSKNLLQMWFQRTYVCKSTWKFDSIS